MLNLRLDNFTKFIVSHLRGETDTLEYPEEMDGFVFPKVLFFAAPDDVKQTVLCEYDGSLKSIEDILNILIEDKDDVWLSFAHNCTDKDVMLIDAVYGMLCQVAAKEERTEHSIDVAMLHFVLPERFQHLGLQYSFIGNMLMDQVMDTISRHPLTDHFFFDLNHITYDEVVEALGVFIPCPNVNMFVELEDGSVVDCQPMTNYNLGFGGQLGFHRIDCLAGRPSRFPDCDEFFAEKYEIVALLYDYSYELLDNRAKGIFDAVMRIPKNYIQRQP